MKTSTIIAVLPIGEFDTDDVKNGFDSIVGVLNSLEAELLIADPVSDPQKAQQHIQNFHERNPALLLLIPLRGLSAQVMEATVLSSQIPCLICPVQGRFALPSSLLAIGALQDLKIPVELIYAPYDHPEFIERLKSAIKTAEAFSCIRRSRIGIVGDLFPNLIACRYEPEIIHSRLGVTLVPISFEEIRNLIQSISVRANLEQQREIASSYKIDAADFNALNTGIQLHLAIRQLAIEKELDGFATECWSGFPRELGLNPCMGFVEDTYTLACEGDVMLCISLLLVRYLLDTSAYVGDLYDVDMAGILTLVHCGAPASLAAKKEEIVLSRSQLALERGFETITCRPRLENGPVTLFRFYGRECDKLHLAYGELVSSELSPNLTAKIKLISNRWDFLNQCFGNHYVMVNGDIRNELKLLGKWLEITIFET